MPHASRPAVRLSEPTRWCFRRSTAVLLAVGLALPATAACASPAPQGAPSQPSPAAKEQQAAEQAAKAAQDRQLAEKAARADDATRRADDATRRADDAIRYRDAAVTPEEELVRRVVGVPGSAEQIAAVIRDVSEGAVRARGMNNTLVLSGHRKAMEAITPLLQELIQLESARLDQEQARMAQQMNLEKRRRDEAMHEQQIREEEARKHALAMLPPDRRVADVQLSGTLGESLSGISNQFGGVNVIYTDDGSLEKMPVRSVSLHRVTLRAALAALESLCGGRADFEFNSGLAGTTDEAVASQSRPVVMVSPSRRSDPFGAPAAQLAVFRLDPVNGDIAPEDRERVTEQHRALLEAIVLGLELVGRSSGFKMQIHPQTGMLFVHGTPDELRIVSQVLDMPMPELAPTPPPVPRAVPLVQDTVAAPSAPAAASTQPVPAAPAREALPARPPQPAPRDSADDAPGGTPTP